MRKIVFLVFFSLFVFGFTPPFPSPSPRPPLVVDKNPTGGMSCIGTPNPYSTIQEAMNAAQDGDTIKVCPGTYEESIEWNKTNITLEGTSDNRDDVKIKSVEAGITINISSGSVTVRNLTIESGENAIYFKNHPSSALFENIAIDTVGDGIYAESNMQNFHLKNSHIEVSNASSSGIHFKGDTNGKFIVEKSIIESIYFNNNVNQGIQIKDTNLTSLGVRGSINNGITLENVTMQGSNVGLSVEGDINGDANFTAVTISSNYTSIDVGGNVSNFNLKNSKMSSGTEDTICLLYTSPSPRD
jgi:MSHA biogenesis protein MshQ